MTIRKISELPDSVSWADCRKDDDCGGFTSTPVHESCLRSYQTLERIRLMIVGGATHRDLALFLSDLDDLVQVKIVQEATS